MKGILILTLVFSFSVSVSAIDYKNDVLPIMKEHCWDCHSGDDYKGNLNLDVLKEMHYHIGKFNVIRPGNSKESSFLEKMLLPESDRDFMPRKGSRLPEKELNLIAKWIDAGAVVDASSPTEDEAEWVKKSSATTSAASGQEYIKWTSNDGKALEARFRGLQGSAVKLILKDGRAFTVPFSRLSAESVAMAKKLAEKK